VAQLAGDDGTLLRPLAARLTLAFALLDATFKPLVGLAFLMLMGAARQSEVSQLALTVVVPVWFCWLGVVWLIVRPLDRFAGRPSGSPRSESSRCCSRC
jgi:hypothetical protein